MLCGIIYKKYGFNNVGFHLGDDVVTFDIDGELDRDALDEIELIANGYVFDNRAVTTSFPRRDELPTLSYRAKLDITEGVRLVKIGDVDICACCAPHVSYTGEIGMIKILDFMKHRGGTRIWMVAGKRALLDYRGRYENTKRISNMLCAPQSDVADVLQGFIAESELNRAELKAARIRVAELEAERVEPTTGNAVFCFPDFSMPELIAFSNVANMKVDGITVALCGSERDYRYVISSRGKNLREISSDINRALNGRGGGRPEMIQGSFTATLSEIKDYFK
jgi:alanyl-tRNA synthetase